MAKGKACLDKSQWYMAVFKVRNDMESRNEKLLKAILGDDVDIEAPKSRIEILLKRLLDEGAIGKITAIWDNGTVTIE